MVVRRAALGYYIGDHGCCAGKPCLGWLLSSLWYSERYGRGKTSLLLCEEAINQSINRSVSFEEVDCVTRRRARQIYSSFVGRSVFRSVRYVPFGSVQYVSVWYGLVRFSLACWWHCSQKKGKKKLSSQLHTILIKLAFFFRRFCCGFLFCFLLLAILVLMFLRHTAAFKISNFAARV